MNIGDIPGRGDPGGRGDPPVTKGDGGGNAGTKYGEPTNDGVAAGEATGKLKGEAGTC